MDYAAQADVPTEIVEVAKCRVPGVWKFGQAVHVTRNGSQWVIRPQDPANKDGPALVIATAHEGCTIKGEEIDIGNPVD